MMNKRFRFIIVFLGVVLLVASCQKESATNVDPTLLPGKWQREGTQEYWRYRSNGQGVTWDEADDITEEESNLTFTWTLDGEVLTHVFTGSSGQQAVPKVFTITYLGGSTMHWTDDYGSTIHLIRQ